jgi:hypothetical protein
MQHSVWQAEQLKGARIAQTHGLAFVEKHQTLIHLLQRRTQQLLALDQVNRPLQHKRLQFLAGALAQIASKIVDLRRGRSMIQKCRARGMTGKHADLTRFSAAACATGVNPQLKLHHVRIRYRL